MDNQYITLAELLALLAVFVAPFLIAGAVVQYILLRRVEIRGIRALTIVVLAAFVTLALSWSLLYVMRGTTLLVFGYGSALILPAVIAAGVVTLAIGWYARRRRGKPGFAIGGKALVVSVALSMVIWTVGYVFNASNLAATLVFPAMSLLLHLRPGQTVHDVDHTLLFVSNIAIYFVFIYLLLLTISRIRKLRKK